MTTEAQVAANRVNAQKSTGPRTPEGKAAVAQNAVTHGLRAQAVVLPGEDREEYSRYHTALLEELHPEGFEETELAERIAGLCWQLRRAGRYHSAVFDALYEQYAAEMAETAPPEAPADGPHTSDPVLGRMLVADFSGPRVLERVQLYERRIESSLSRARAEWRQLRDRLPLSGARGTMAFGGLRDGPAGTTHAVVTGLPHAIPPVGEAAANRPKDTLGQTKPIEPRPVGGNGYGGTNKANSSVKKPSGANKQSQWQPQELTGLDLVCANRADSGGPIGVLADLAARRRLR